MMAAAYWWGWLRAHPAWVLIFLWCAAVLAVLVIVTWAENRRDDRIAGSPEAPRRGTRSRAGGARARRRALLGSACRRAGTARAWVASWFWWWDSPAGPRPWQAARERLARSWARQAVTRRIQKLRVIMTPAKEGRSGKGSAGVRLESRPAARADLTGSLALRPHEGPSRERFALRIHGAPLSVPGREEDGRDPKPQPAASTMGPRAALPGEPSHPAGDPVPRTAREDCQRRAAYKPPSRLLAPGERRAAEARATRPWSWDTGEFAAIGERWTS